MLTVWLDWPAMARTNAVGKQERGRSSLCHVAEEVQLPRKACSEVQLGNDERGKELE